MPDPKLYIEVLNDGSQDLYIRDAEAQEEIAEIKETIKNGSKFIGKLVSAEVGGETVTVLHDGDVPESITTDEGTFVPGTPEEGEKQLNNGDYLIVQGAEGAPSLEFMWTGTKLSEYGSTSVLKGLAFKDTATGSVTAAGSNAPSAVSFTGTEDGDFVTGFDVDPVLPSFTEGAFDAGSLPSKDPDTFNAGALPSFTEGAFTPAEIQTGFVTAGTAATFTEGTFDAGTLPSMTYDSVNRKLTFSAGTLPSKASDTFDGGTPTAIDVTKFDGGSKAADTFAAGSLPSYTEGTFDAGSLPSKASDTFSAGTAPTLATDKAITDLGSAEAAAQTFTGSAVSVSVS